MGSGHTAGIAGKSVVVRHVEAEPFCPQVGTAWQQQTIYLTPDCKVLCQDD